MGLAAVSCNAKDEDTVKDDYLASESVAITAFSLSADARVMRNLDSVFFSIDLEHGVVFNADSLPKGTKITKLIPKITYASTVTSAVIEMKGGTHREDGTVNYKANPNDTIDFTADVTLTLSTKNDISKTYTLKVNVHQEDPDTMYWDAVGDVNLPSRLADPKAQKSVEFGSGVATIIEEADGTYTFSRTSDIFSEEWTKTEISLGFTPRLSSLSSDNSGNLYILSEQGELMQSASGTAWTAAASGWSGIIGMYGEYLIGISGEGTSRRMVSLPSGLGDGIAIPADFPSEGYTRPIEFTNRWTSDPTIVIFGGVSSATQSGSWAFDGSQWVDIADKALPYLEGLSVVKYYSYLNSATNGLLKEFEAYLAFGGRDALGNVNETVYITYDNGISWQRAQKYMQLPETVEAGYMVDAIALGTTKESNLTDRWNARRRIPFQVEGDIVKWDCPYIFLFGGYDTAFRLNPTVRSGVLQRLTFVPLF